jgi:hypothetical protein
MRFIKMHNFTHLLEFFVCLYIMLKSRKTKRGRIIRGKTNRRRQRGGFNNRDVVSVRGIVIGVNDDETVNVAFYDNTRSRIDVSNIPNSSVTFIKPGKEFRVSPIPALTPVPELMAPAAAAPQVSRFRVRPLPDEYRF